MTSDPPATARVDTGWLLLVAVATYPSLQFVRRVVDTSATVVDESGTTHFVSDGRASGPAQLLLGAVVLATAVHLTIRAHRAGTVRLNVWAVTALVLMLCDLLRPEPDPVVLLSSGVAFVALLGVGFGTLTGQALGRIGLLTGGVAVSLLLFAVVSPSEGFDRCREDKCSFTGALLRGYFPQENVVGLFLVALLPSVAFVRGRISRNVLLLLVIISVLMTGSRTSITAMGLAVLAVILIRRRSDATRQHGDSAKVLSLLPLVSFVVSLATVFAVSGLSLTGRGYIFEIVRGAWVSDPFIGPGRQVVTEAYSRSQAWWYIAHEHGQGAYLLAQAGLVGVVMFTACLTAIVVACWRTRSPIPSLFALVPAVGFQTEPVWEFTLSSPFIASLLITAALCTSAGRGALPGIDSQEAAVTSRQSQFPDIASGERRS